jgi:hypothetical protein
MPFKTFAAILRACGSAVLLAVSVAGCDFNDLLDVSDPSRLLSENVEVPAQASALMNGVEADFICAFGAYVVTTADFSDEFEDTNSSGDVWSVDRRRPEPQNSWGGADCTGTLPGIYVSASRARWVADNLARLLETWTDAEVPSRQTMLARTYLLSGFSLYMLAASHCEIALDLGPKISSAQAFAEAETRFTKAIAAAGSPAQADIKNAALVGRARVRLYQGNKAGATTDAQAVPAGFVMKILPSDAAPRMYNRVWSAVLLNYYFGVPVWSRNLKTGGVVDPRTAVYDLKRVSTWAPGSIWGPSKYPTASSPFPIARWEEAQLIIAEVQGGQTAVGIINALRDKNSLPRFSSTNESEIQQAVVDERQRELWLEGFRMYDINRLKLPLYPAPGADYQTGSKGGTYGSDLCLPLPNVELFNNPTIRGGGD